MFKSNKGKAHLVQLKAFQDELKKEMGKKENADLVIIDNYQVRIKKVKALLKQRGEKNLSLS